MIPILAVILFVIAVTFLRHYFWCYEVLNESGERVIRGSYRRCYSHYSAHPYRIEYWTISRIK